MKVFALILSLVSFHAFGALDMKPGLWVVDMNINSGGTSINPSKEVEKALANMPEAKRKKLMEQMGNVAPGAPDKNGMKVCYSKAMLKDPNAFDRQGQGEQKCTSKVRTNKPSELATSFKCTDGTTGDATWKVTNPELFHGKVNLKTPKGEKSEIFYTGKFSTTDCGGVKPIL